MTALLIAVLLAPLGAHAGGAGVVEIDHTCAAAAGCFSGDTPGYPVTIDGSSGHSYVLTSNLIVPNENTDGLVVSTSNVSIDLNGFEIVRAGCGTTSATCTPALGSGSGVERSSSALRGLSVQNGSITGMGAYGVWLGQQATVSGLRVRWNRLDGIFVDDASLVTENLAYENGDDGISGDQGTTVSWNVVARNGNDGIIVSLGSTVKGNTVYDNGDEGINAGFGVAVQGNTSYSNTGYGLFLGDAAYRENVVHSNGDGAVLGGTNLGSNLCGAAICP